MRKRSAGALWLLGAVIVVGIFLLLDPGEWFGDGRAAEADPISSPASETPSLAPGPPLETILVATDAAVPEEVARHALDPVADAGLASLRVLDPLGRVMSGAHVLLVREGAILLDKETDEAGEVVLAADARTAGLFVAVEARPPEWHEVRLDPGRQDVLLSDGEALEGRIEREDGERTGRLELELSSDHPLPTAAGIPAVVWKTLGVRTRDRTRLRCDTDDDGAFAFAGLPPSWSGSLRLPFGRRVLDTSEGEIEPFANGVRLARPVAGFVVRIASRVSIHGRLVLRDDGSPLGGALVMAMVRMSGADSTVPAPAEADEDGRFDLRRDPGQIEVLDLRVGEIRVEGPSLLSLRGADLPPDGDLGDVVVDEVGNVPFVLQDPEGTPIAGGTAAAAGIQSAPTGKDGRSELRWLARAVESMAVTAGGFVPREVELPDVIAAPLVVVLEPTNRLDVHLLPPAGGNPRQFKILLRREEGLTAARLLGTGEQYAHVGEWAFPPLALLREPADTYLTSRPRETDGVASFFALRAGVEIELVVIGVGGDDEFHRETLAPLGPTEVRRHEVALGDEVRVFRGRVLDEEGNPLVQASLNYGRQILGSTDEEGTFLCFVRGDEPDTLRIRHDTCSTLVRHGYVVPTDGLSVEFRLDPGHRVIIEVVDQAGRPVIPFGIWIEQAGNQVGSTVIEANRYVARTLADGPCEITTQVAGRFYTQAHDAAVGEVQVVVPLHGSFAAVVSDAATANREGRFLLELRPAEGEPGRPLGDHRPSAPGLRLEMPLVHPGPYEAALVYRPSREERDAGGEEARWDPVPVTIEADEETTLHFDLPAGG